MLPENRHPNMRSFARRSCLALIIVLAASPLIAQVTLEEPIEDRVLALEMAVANIDSRLQSGVTSSMTNSVQDNTLARRLSELETRLDGLTRDLQRVERSTEMAMSEATQARREASNAERVARDASLLVR
jgi:predicted  nucleic acid-binding Zn-ribbon protein